MSSLPHRIMDRATSRVNDRNMISEPVLRLCHVLVRKKCKVIKAFGRARPLDNMCLEHESENACGEGGVGGRLQLNSPYAVEKMLNVEESRAMVVEVIFSVFVRSQSLEVIEEWSSNPETLFIFRIISFILRTCWINTNRLQRGDPLVKISRHLIDHFLKVRNGASDICLRGSLSWFIALGRAGGGKTSNYSGIAFKNRQTLLHRFCTRHIKRVLNHAINNLITIRYQDAINKDQLFRCVNPDVNFAHRVACIELILTKVTEISLDDLLIILDQLLHHLQVPTGGFGTLTRGKHTDADLLHLISSLLDIAKSWIQTKVIEVNEPHCTCHVKCTPLIGDNPKVENYFYQSCAPLHCATTICGGCRLSLTVANTTAKKPRRVITSHNPKLTTCTDGISALKHLPLYAFRVLSPQTFLYSHRFYTTNSTGLLQAPSTKTPPTPTSRIFGMCYYGDRTCLRRLTCRIPGTGGARSDEREASRSLFRCLQCEAGKKITIGDRQNRSWLGSKDSKSCIPIIFYKLKHEVSVERLTADVVDRYCKKMCSGCRVALTCRHVNDELTSAIVQSVDTTERKGLLKTFVYILSMQRWIKAVGLRVQ